MLQSLHMNARIIAANFVAAMKGMAVSPAEQAERRRKRQAARAFKRWQKHASYPYSGTGARKRYARQEHRRIIKAKRAELIAYMRAYPSPELQADVSKLDALLVFLRTGGYLVRGEAEAVAS